MAASPRYPFDPELLRTVIFQLPVLFSTRDAADHPALVAQYDPPESHLTLRYGYYARIGAMLSEHRDALQIEHARHATSGLGGSSWRRTSAFRTPTYYRAHPSDPDRITLVG